MIWDVHTHLHGLEGATPEARMARLVAFAQRMGVERIVVMMGFPFVPDPTPQELRRQNDQVLQALSHHHDRAFGFVYVSGKYPEASVKEIDRCIRDGPMVGVKLWVARRCLEKDLDAIVERAAALKAPLLQHTWHKVAGNLGGESTTQDLATLARRHPGASFICGHCGGDWELGLRAFRGIKNVVTEVSGSDPTAGFVEMAVRELGADRVLFGSDAGGRSFASQIAKVRGAEVPETAKKLIFRENLRRLLSPILTAKGVRP